MRLIKTQNPDFSRDESNYALINTNVSAFNLYKQQRKNRNNITAQDKEIDNLKSEINELKLLVKQLVKEKNGQDSC
jgi:cell division protein FtsB